MAYIISGSVLLRKILEIFYIYIIAEYANLKSNIVCLREKVVGKKLFFDFLANCPGTLYCISPVFCSLHFMFNTTEDLLVHAYIGRLDWIFFLKNLF